MLIKTIVQEDFANYKTPSMLIGMCFCNWKCCLEGNFPITVCQNQSLNDCPNINVPVETIFEQYISNPITQAICFGGLEPMIQFDELLSCIKYFRENNCQDDVIIYTGYTKEELQDQIEQLKQYPNIIIKFGRYIINSEKIHDPVLQVDLASSNQYAEKIL